MDTSQVNRDMTTTERLHWVADVIENEPDHWDQKTYVQDPQERGLLDFNDGASLDCGTTFCLSGWTSLAMPHEDVARIVKSWWGNFVVEGLGCDERLAEILVYARGEEPGVMSGLLRALAHLPESRRTYEYAKENVVIGAHVSAVCNGGEW